MDDHIKFNEQIIQILTEHALEFPTERFGQILFNLDINQFKDRDNPESTNFLYRDIYGDSSEEILKRIKERRIHLRKQ
jgi:hypothetical protein